MTEHEIKNLDELLEPYLEPGSLVVDHKTKRLTAPGENYGSSIMAVEVLIKTTDNRTRLLYLVSKHIPENEFLQKMFKVAYTFPKELEFYRTVLPTLVQFQLDQGVSESEVMDFYPKFYGGRKNLCGDPDLVDKDGVILMENLKSDGYRSGDRLKGYDLDAAKVILKNLAVFHAVPIALKLTKPEVFKEKILSNINFVKIFDETGPEVASTMLGGYITVAEEDEACALLVERLTNTVMSNIETQKPTPREPFATIAHCDCWINNTMQKINEETLINKFVDFQLVCYASPAKDVVFFLYSSVEMSVVENFYDELINTYHEEFIKTLRDLGIEELEQFSLEAFDEEAKHSVKEFELFHCLFMIKTILEPPCGIVDQNNMSENVLMDNNMSPLQKEKIWFVIKEFAKRGWI